MITTKQGHIKIALNGFMYIKNQQRNGRAYWRCAIKKCSGSCTSDELYLAGEPGQGRQRNSKFWPVKIAINFTQEISKAFLSNRQKLFQFLSDLPHIIDGPEFGILTLVLLEPHPPS